MSLRSISRSRRKPSPTTALKTSGISIRFDLDSQQAATELEVLRSERLLRPTFESLGLADRAELTSGRDGFWPALAHYLHYLTLDTTPYDPSSAP